MPLRTDPSAVSPSGRSIGKFLGYFDPEYNEDSKIFRRNSPAALQLYFLRERAIGGGWANVIRYEVAARDNQEEVLEYRDGLWMEGDGFVNDVTEVYVLSDIAAKCYLLIRKRKRPYGRVAVYETD